MYNHITTLASTYRPTRSTLVKVKNHPYTQVAGTVLGTTVEVTGIMAQKTVIPAAVAGACYLQQQLDPNGFYDHDIDRLATAACHGLGVVVGGITAVKDVLTPELNQVSFTGQRAIPCDVGMVELCDWDDNLLFPARQTDNLSTYTAATPSPYAKSDDGIEGLQGVDLYEKTSSLRTSLRSGMKKDGRGVAKSGLGDEGWEFMELEDQCDSEAEEFQQEKLANPLAEDGCREVVEEGRKPGTTDFGFGEEELSQSQIEEKEEGERLCLEAKWISHEAARAERGEKTRALDTIMNEGGFLPSVTFMRADMEGENRARQTDLEEEKAKYVGHKEAEEGATYVEDIPADILVEYEKRGVKSEEASEEEVTTGEDNITASRDDYTHEVEAKAEVIPSEALLSE